MKELKQKEKIYLEEYDVYVNKYLKISEIKLIVGEILSEDNACDRIMIKNMYLLKFATDVEISDEINSDEYDLFVGSGLMDMVIENVENSYDINMAIDNEESIRNTFKKFINNLDGTINDLSKRVPNKKKLEGFIDKLDVIAKKNDK